MGVGIIVIKERSNEAFWVLNLVEKRKDFLQSGGSSYFKG